MKIISFWNSGFIKKIILFFLIIVTLFTTVNFIEIKITEIISIDSIIVTVFSIIEIIITVLFLLILFNPKVQNKEKLRPIFAYFLLAILTLVALLPSLFLSMKLSFIILSPSQYFELKRLNEEKIDNKIPSEDIQKIKKMSKKISDKKLYGISFYNCAANNDLKNKRATESAEIIHITTYPLDSELCQDGDVILILGQYKNGGILDFNYYLIRKNNNDWQVIENLGHENRSLFL